MPENDHLSSHQGKQECNKNPFSTADQEFIRSLQGSKSSSTISELSGEVTEDHPPAAGLDPVRERSITLDASQGASD